MLSIAETTNIWAILGCLVVVKNYTSVSLVLSLGCSAGGVRSPGRVVVIDEQDQMVAWCVVAGCVVAGCLVVMRGALASSEDGVMVMTRAYI
jgi:hypothetical protein